MLGFRLFRHAVLMLIDNLGAAFRISLMPAVIFFVTMVLMISVAQAAMNIGLIWLIFLVIIVLSMCLFLWVAVAWHRYVLREEEPTGIFPTWHGPEISAYFWASLRVVLMSLLIAIPAVVIASVIRGGSFNTNEGSGLAFFINTLITYFAIRWSLVLPAAAVGQEMSVGESWNQSRPFGGTILIAVVCVALLVNIPVLLAGSFLGEGLGSLAYFTVASWLQIMLSISLLTALYGHITENRPLR